MPVSNIPGNYSLNLTFNNILYNTFNVFYRYTRFETRQAYNDKLTTYCQDLFRYLSLTFFVSLRLLFAWLIKIISRFALDLPRVDHK